MDYEGCSYLKKYFQFEGTVDEKKAKIDTPEEFKPLLKSMTKKVLSMHKLKGKLLSVLSMSDLYSCVSNVKLFLIFYQLYHRPQFCINYCFMCQFQRSSRKSSSKSCSSNCPPCKSVSG